MEKLKEKIDKKEAEGESINKRVNECIMISFFNFKVSGLQTSKEKSKENEGDGESMNEVQVNAWFERNKLDLAIKELVEPCNGQMLKQFWEIKDQCHQFFMQLLKNKLVDKPKHDELIKQFSLALDKMFSS